MPPSFSQRSVRVEGLLKAAKKVMGGEDPVSAGFTREDLETYGNVARRYRDDKDLGLTRYPYEAAPGVSPYSGGFFPHPAWHLKRGMEKHSSLRAIAEYESQYVNCVGYWMAFSETAGTLRDEKLALPGEEGDQEAQHLDVWAAVSLRYGLRAAGLRAEFYRLSAVDPQNARLLMPALEQKAIVPAADDLDEVLSKMDSHLSAQLMKAAAALSAQTAVKRSGGGAPQ